MQPLRSNRAPDTILRHFRPQRRLSVKNYVQRRLLRLIERGQINIGDQIPSPARIAERIGRSPGGVAEAIAELRDWGLFESRANLGTFLVRTHKLAQKIARPKGPVRFYRYHDDDFFYF